MTKPQMDNRRKALAKRIVESFYPSTIGMELLEKSILLAINEELMPDRTREIYNCIPHNSWISTGEVAVMTGFASPNVGTRLSFLEKQGMVQSFRGNRSKFLWKRV